MPRSMTGFGRASRESERAHVTVCLRSVNHKGLKLSAKLPDAIAAIQPALEAEVRRVVDRGAVQLDVRYRALGGESRFVLDRRRLRHYLDALAELQANLGVDGPPIRIDAVAQLPGVIVEVESDEVGEPTLQEDILPVLHAALEQFTASRAREGEALAADLRALRVDVLTHLEHMRTRLPEALTSHLTRTRARIAELLAGMGVAPAEESLAREVALLADRTDIREEVTRLAAHLDELDRALIAKEPIGARLEFLAQEMQREANTMGAKTQDAELLREILDIKVAVSRVKEQVANLE